MCDVYLFIRVIAVLDVESSHELSLLNALYQESPFQLGFSLFMPITIIFNQKVIDHPENKIIISLSYTSHLKSRSQFPFHADIKMKV